MFLNSMPIPTPSSREPIRWRPVSCARSSELHQERNTKLFFWSDWRHELRRRRIDTEYPGRDRPFAPVAWAGIAAHVVGDGDSRPTRAAEDHLEPTPLAA
jgi:hypothetical protein